MKRGKYRNVARVAEVPETSTPSERVFSICGLADTAERSNNLGLLIQKSSILLQQSEINPLNPKT